MEGFKQCRNNYSQIFFLSKIFQIIFHSKKYKSLWWNVLLLLFLSFFLNSLDWFSLKSIHVTIDSNKTKFKW